jgi:hypothetical protein
VEKRGVKNFEEVRQQYSQINQLILIKGRKVFMGKFATENKCLCYREIFSTFFTNV